MASEKDPDVATGIAERLTKARGRLSQGAFAEQLGLSLAGYRNYEKGEREPPIAVITKVSRLTGLSVQWLILGQAYERGDDEDERSDDPPDLAAAIAGLRRIHAAEHWRDFEFLRGAITMADPGIEAEKKERATGTDGRPGPSRRGW